MMQILESIRMAIAALVGNKMRAALTTLGIVIGIGVVLLMGWMLAGLDSALEETLSIFGDDILYIDKFDWTGEGNWLTDRNRKNITYDQYLRVEERIRGAELVLPTVRQSARSIRYGDLELTGTTMFGTTARYVGILGGNIEEGRFFTEAEESSASLVAVLGSGTVDALFPNGDALGKTIKVDGLPFVVVGTLPKRGTLMADFVDNQVIIPLKRFFGMYGKQRVVINVKAGGPDKVEEVKYETIGVMRQVRSLAPETPNDFAINTQEQFREQANQLRAVVWSVGVVMTGLSFLVGSIGIMNIMFVSVTERTKEIGIRKAVGATRRSVLLQFLVEAVILCLLGSIISLIFTSGIAFAGAWYLRTEHDITFLNPYVPPDQIGIALAVSVLVGIMAGVIPAYRAAKLDPVEALRAD